MYMYIWHHIIYYYVSTVHSVYTYMYIVISQVVKNGLMQMFSQNGYHVYYQTQAKKLLQLPCYLLV